MTATATKVAKDKKFFEDRLASRFTKSEQKFGNVLTRIEQDGKFLKDFVLNPKTIQFTSNGKVYANFKDERFNLHLNAVEQLGEKLAIPPRYLRDLAYGDDQRKALAAKILQETVAFTDIRERVLVRSVGSEIRGVLSDSYRRIDGASIVESFIKACIGQGARLIDGCYDDTKYYLEVVFPEVFMLDTEKNGTVATVVGCKLRNSDFGCGRLMVQTYMENIACYNGLTNDTAMSIVHLGKTISDNIEYSEKTYRLDTETQASAVNDIVNKTLSKQEIERQLDRILQASAIDVEIEEEIVQLPKITPFTKGEAEKVKTYMAAGKAEDGCSGEPTLWKLVQAMTRVSNDSEDEVRKREMQEIAGKFMEKRIKD